MKRYIKQGIEEFTDKGYMPWHMPGHKRRRLDEGVSDGASSLYDALDRVNAYDVTELGLTDDYLRPEGFFKDALAELSSVYGSVASYYLVNGSTSGVQAAVCACAAKRPEAGKILVGADCHRSVYNIARLIGLEVVRLDEVTNRLDDDGLSGLTNGFDTDGLTGKLNDLDVSEFCAVVITSPDYDGVCKDVKKAADFAHGMGLPLIVDEAHGAHLWFSEKQRRLSALCNGADIVVQSLHKTMPSPTQTALIHVMNEAYADEVRDKLEMLLSSSPSFPMLAAMERAVAWADENRLEFDAHLERVNEFTDRLLSLRLRIQPYKFSEEQEAFRDKTRLCLAAEGVSGAVLEELLISEGVAVEMSATDHIVLISTVMDDEKAFEDLYEAVVKASKRLESLQDSEVSELAGTLKSLDGEDDNSYNDLTNTVDITGIIGTVAERDIYVYPPGSPIVLKGQVIDEAIVHRIEEYIRSGKKVHGL